MSDPNQKPKSEDETVTLHLGAFAPGHHSPGSSPSPESEDEGITMIVERAAAEVVRKRVEPRPASTSGEPAAPPPPEEMLGAVAYSYAKGVYRSEDIARKMENDPEYSAAAGDHLPDAKAIRRFRRLNRGAILETLANVFRRQRKKKTAASLSQTMPGAEPATPPSAPPSGKSANEPGETTIVSRRDAEDKLNKAAWVDNMSKDD